MIRFQNVRLSYGDAPVLEIPALHIAPGERTALMGPSGCGKTSLLKLAAGLMRPDAGTAEVNARRIAFVFQEPRLLPWRNTAENVAAVLEGSKKAALERAADWLERLGLGTDMDKYPRELSGGMAQRVNIARALAFDGDLLLLDEPFKGLDEARRTEVVDIISSYAGGRTLLLATHDRGEAEALCGRILTYEDNTFR